MKNYSFETLDCWKHARKLTVWIYKITNLFPSTEKFGLVSQMRRSAVSIASNIAEGTSRKTGRDQAHFSTIAYGSTIELLNDIIIANDLNFLSKNQYIEGRNLVENQTLLIAKLRTSQNGTVAHLAKP